MGTEERDTVLLVEDDTITALAEASAIRRFGYEVIIAHSGEKAVQLAGDLEIKLILMDVHLGKGLDGIQAAFELRATTQAPLVFLTSCAESEVAPRVQALSHWTYLAKGSIESVAKAIREAMPPSEASPSGNCHIGGKMVPPKTHPRFKQLVTGEFTYSFRALAGSMCVSRNQREVRRSGKDEKAVAAAIDDVHAFFVKFEKALAADIDAIFG
jgi:CheY-like chemotaxis protein